MDITKILYEIIEEAINGKVMLGDDPWPFYFNTYLNYLIISIIAFFL